MSFGYSKSILNKSLTNENAHRKHMDSNEGSALEIKCVAQQVRVSTTSKHTT